MTARILVAVPSLDQCPIDFACALAAMFGQHTRDKRNGKIAEMTLIHQRGSNYVHARNELVRGALALDASHILFIDSDMTFPPDTATRLLSHHVTVVGANYCRREEANPSLLGAPLPRAQMRGALRPMFHLPLGLMMLKVDALDAVHSAPPWFSYRHSGAVSEDTEFCDALRSAGHTIWCDEELTKQVGHVGMKVYRP